MGTPEVHPRVGTESSCSYSPHTIVTSLAVVLSSDAMVRAQEKPGLHASPGFVPLPGRRAGGGRGFGYPQGAERASSGWVGAATHPERGVSAE